MQYHCIAAATHINVQRNHNKCMLWSRVAWHLLGCLNTKCSGKRVERLTQNDAGKNTYQTLCGWIAAWCVLPSPLCACSL